MPALWAAAQWASPIFTQVPSSCQNVLGAKSVVPTCRQIIAHEPRWHGSHHILTPGGRRKRRPPRLRDSTGFNALAQPLTLPVPRFPVCEMGLAVGVAVTERAYVHKNFQKIPGHRMEAQYTLASVLFVLEPGKDILTPGRSPEAALPCSRALHRSHLLEKGNG